MAENRNYRLEKNVSVSIANETGEPDDVLTGPPEICVHFPITRTTSRMSSAAPSATKKESAQNGVINEETEWVNIENEDTDWYNVPKMGRTENNSATYLSSGNACLNFFCQVVPDTPSKAVVDLLAEAWKEDPLTALKLAFQLRGVRDKGKTDKENFYTVALWLHEYHPLTLLANIDKVAAFGYYKDLPGILLRIVEGAEGYAVSQHRKSLFEDAKAMKQKPGAKQRSSRWPKTDTVAEKTEIDPKALKKVICKTIDQCTRKGCSICKSITDDIEKLTVKSENSTFRSLKRIAQATKALKMFNQDPSYRRLYHAVAELFAEQLKKDVSALKEGNTHAPISLAAKWCPSLDASYDRQTLLCEGIARKFYKKAEFPEYEDIDDRTYAYRIRDRMRKEVLVPLRKALELPEVAMSANGWEDVNYKRVASVAMKNYKKLFLKHDEARFKSYLEDVSQGKAKIAASALLPHEITREALQEDDDDAMAVVELQWKRMVDDLKRKGTLSDSIAVCDVSGSMAGIPMDVCVALGLLVAEINEDPWKGRIISFSATPELHTIEGSTLRDKVKFTVDMGFGFNTNFQAVFDKILDVAQASKLPPERMVKRLFVFSDMEFDEASENPWETDYEVICSKFLAAGYGSPPEIVFWNLRHSSSIPVLGEQEGVALVAGFSKNLLETFMEKGKINPMDTMMNAIAGKSYESLIVVD